MLVWPASTLDAFHLGRLVADEGGAHRDGAGRDVVDEVVALGIRQGVERRPHDVHLGVRDGRARLVSHPAFDFTSRALGEERPAPTPSATAAYAKTRATRAKALTRQCFMDTSSKGVNLRVRPTLERGAHTPPLGSVACFGMRLLWEYTCIRRGARRRSRHRVRRPRPGQRCLIWSTKNFMSSKGRGQSCDDARRCNSLKPERLPVETPAAAGIEVVMVMSRRVRGRNSGATHRKIDGTMIGSNRNVESQ